MKNELKELSIDMIDDKLYDMYQDIPDGENGQSNEAYGLDKEKFKEYIKKEIDRKNNEITTEDTPTITYIMYVENNPVGYICVRTKIDNNWMKWSGNIYYQIRSSERNKGYGTSMLKLVLKECKKLGFKEVFINSSAGNIASEKVIINNNGEFIKEDNGSKYFKITL